MKCVGGHDGADADGEEFGRIVGESEREVVGIGLKAGRVVSAQDETTKYRLESVGSAGRVGIRQAGYLGSVAQLVEERIDGLTEAGETRFGDCQWQ